MLIQNLKEFNSVSEFKPYRKQWKLKKILMAAPSAFDVCYEINPFMKQQDGQLNQVDPKVANTQWESLKSTYEKIGLKVDVIDGPNGLPDFVFCANQSFPFQNPVTGVSEVVMSRMFAEQRRNEVQYFEAWYTAQGYKTHTIQDSNLSFEGNGDAILSKKHNLVFGGYGPRTNKDAYSELAERFGLDTIQLNLVTDEFYHLDTCFFVLDNETAAFYPGAFDDEGQKLIRAYFDRVIEVDYNEARNHFACNAHCPDGKNVILHPGSEKLVENLKALDYLTHEVDTSEFMKAGGSVFCMKMEIF